MGDSSLNVLIVEDDLALAVDMEMMMDELGHQVIGRVDNSTDALKKIEQHQPDLILMDIKINGELNGIQIAEMIKDKNIPILYVTSENNQGSYDKAQKTNLIGYLIKPVYKYTLKTTIEAGLNGEN